MKTTIIFFILTLFLSTFSLQAQDVFINACSGSYSDTGGSTFHYGNDEDNMATFCSTNGEPISITFIAFSLEGYDFLKAYDGPNDMSPALFTNGQGWSGINSPGTLTSSGTCLTFAFTSDDSITGPGWLATYSCNAPTPQDYPNPGGTINSCSGIFTDSGSLGSTYSNNENITTTICSDDGDVVNVNFAFFDTEANNDILSIYDGTTTNVNNLIGNYSGINSPGSVFSTGTCLTFVWTSNATINTSGWQATINCGFPPMNILNPGGTINRCNGTFKDSGGNSNYANNENVITTICPDAIGDCITTNFTSFETEGAYYDYLEIFDGDNISSPSLGIFQETTSPGVITATGASGCLTFRFITDEYVSAYSGWEADISCNSCGLLVCAAPQNISHQLQQPANCVINWDAVPYAERYDVIYRVKGTQAWTRVGALSNTKTLRYLAPNTTYQYRVRATCDGTWDFADASGRREFNTANMPQSPARATMPSLDVLTVYPNPVRESIQVNYTIKESSDTHLMIMDMTGRLVLEKGLEEVEGSNSEIIDISTMNPGYYVLIIQSGESRLTKKFVKI